ncbi:MAG: hypothetical protein F6K42_06250 [Leptolyngbya sp. SIO1D8]|nr:hypothetical protein [Leptolyngbya sp. SIO1D8]
MIPVGYMAKRVRPSPDWLQATSVLDVYSVSACISDDFADYISYWQHNGYWFFDSPAIIQQLAQAYELSLQETNLFYYEVHNLEFDATKNQWAPFKPEPRVTTQVIVPSEKVLEGYDVVTFYARANAECSPLSCNALAIEINTNQHCLLASLTEAQQLLEGGQFQHAEPGPYRIFAVYSLGWP